MLSKYVSRVIFRMTKPVGFRVDEKQEKIVRRFRNAVIRKYGKLHGVFSNEIVGMMKKYLEITSSSHTPTNTPSRFTRYHYRLAKIYFKLPNSGIFRNDTVDRLIEKYAGGDDRTKRKYWNALKAWELLIALGQKEYERGHLSDINEWIEEAHQLMLEKEAV